MISNPYKHTEVETKSRGNIETLNEVRTWKPSTSILYQMINKISTVAMSAVIHTIKQTRYPLEKGVAIQTMKQ